MMQVGSITYLSVQVDGGLIWTGDSHAKQGNGEIDLDALETWFPELNITVDLIKNQPQDWPTVETPTSWVAVGYDRDLDKALDLSMSQTVALISSKQGLSATDAQAMFDKTWDCRISQVVDEVLGIDRAIGELCGAIELRLSPTNQTPEILSRLQEIIAAHKGACAVRLMVTPAHRPDVRVQLPLGDSWRITPSRDLVDQLVDLLGDQNTIALEPRKIVKKEDPRQRFRKQPARA